MKRDQIYRQADREQETIDLAYEQGEIGGEEYRQRTHDIQRDLKEACDEACEREQEAVREEWR